MNRLVFILPLAMVAAGCAMTRVHYVDERELVNRVSEDGDVRSAEFVMTTGERLKARQIVADYDSISFFVTRTSSPDGPIGFRRVAASLIGSMTITNHGEGAIEGLKIGAVAGSVGLVGSALADLESDESDLKQALILTAIALPLVAVFGLINGAVLGMKHRYVVEPDWYQSLENPNAPPMSFEQEVAATLLGRWTPSRD